MISKYENLKCTYCFILEWFTNVIDRILNRLICTALFYIHLSMYMVCQKQPESLVFK